jgi:nucleoside-diphosphate-sugar epimerase
VRIIVSGPNGFIGQRLLENSVSNYNIIPISLRNTPINKIEFYNTHSIIHLAGLAHQMQKTNAKRYFDANYELTKELALAAKLAGVPHFVFISTIKVYGETSKSTLDEQSFCNPINDPYGQSKLEAEKFLQSIEDENFQVAIVRPPLVYGPGVKGNLARLMKLVDSWYPLPFGGIETRRSMVFVDNLIELINCIVENKASGVYLAGDKEPMTTSFLIREIRKNLGRNPNLFQFHGFLKSLLFKLKPEMANRLFSSLELDTSSTNGRLRFTPPCSPAYGIARMVDEYKKQKTNV